MIDIIESVVLDTTTLDAIARAVLGADMTGCSVSDTSTIHLLDSASASTQNQAQKIFDNWGNLSPVASVSAMIVGAIDPTVILTSSDDDLEYAVLLDDELYSSGTVAVVAGTATLTLVDPEAGVYDIYFARSAGNYASGMTTITVSES